MLCQAAFAPRSDRADLHVHTTASDGRYTPKQIIDVAVRTGLAALAITDHDTMAGWHAAREFAPENFELIPAVELSCESAGREVHLLGYFVDPTDADLGAAMTRLCAGRLERYGEMVARLGQMGVSVGEEAMGPAPGRRHLAAALVAAGRVGTVREAFHRYLDDHGPVNVPKQRLTVDEGIQLVRAAGGVVSLAHPGPRVDRPALAALAALGLGAVEAEYPTFARSRTAQLRAWANELGLAVTGGSDCHGPDEPRRRVGCRTVASPDLNRLRDQRECARC
jgi:predicted metal-dependent phosphoesterase TrpH